MVKHKNNRIVFQAPLELVDEHTQYIVNELLNADYYVCLTNKEQKTIIDCQSTELLLDCVRHIGETNPRFKEELTNIVIDLQRNNKHI